MLHQRLRSDRAVRIDRRQSERAFEQGSCGGTRAEQMPEDYQRYLVNSLREKFDLPGVPIRLLLRGTKNPYSSA